ncbi:MAG: VanW family protein [Defluviitaleaceae bacterium]|nr:VanW family protein [Defluviitaleaceae bacterium]
MKRFILLFGILALVGCGSAAGVWQEGLYVYEQPVLERTAQTPGTVPKSVGQSPVYSPSPAYLQPTTPQVARADKWVLVEGSAFETKYDESLANRTTNLEIASKVVDGVEIKPGETFSFNEIVGLATEEKGYKEAKIFLKGEEIMGLGGGICQLSSAIFNAAELGGMEIVERHAHSKEVGYVPEGRDAATAYGSVDLKFKNTLNTPVRVRAKMNEGTLTVSIEKKV